MTQWDARLVNQPLQPILHGENLGHTAAVYAGNLVTDRGVWVAGGSTGTDSPGVASIEALDSTHVKVTFEHPAKDNAALNWVGTYEITSLEAPSPLPVYAVVPEAVTNPTYVTLTTDEQVDEAEYTLTLIRMEAA